MASNQEYSPAKLLEIATTDVRSPLQQSDYVSILSKPPFLSVPGTFNTRDIGQVPGSAIRPGLAFRTGSLESLSKDGENVITQQLGIKRIFDLRSEKERIKYPEPEIPEVENEWIPNSYINTVDVKDFASGGGEEGYCKMYMDIMEVYAPTFKAVLEHVRDRPNEPFLFHCALGRDRTGIVAEMLLSLAGSDNETLTLDYMMTRIGSEPLRQVLLERAIQDNGAERGLDDGPFYNLCSLRVSSWELFVEQINSKYGGFEGYATRRLGFSINDLEKIRNNLRARHI
ncbi:tyrosine-protein phosphatase [Colletotrichum spaethianum]|uniref:Tyrosine-protein phosphatase n=1 Tax=Colletotrichum spaethianum TaxID=700344 RepID=A0AA37L1Z1_9PEZI|nr:tyrosine-protein phosphatase [Colletotrichum spaethianum]GKT40367.1 tyrosine-protein phosphatase [Colletotrichum spaethianum]